MEEIRFEIDCDTTLPHFHRELEIFYVLSGRCAVSAQQKNFVLGSEDFVVLNPNEPHEMFKEEGCHTISAFISNEILRQAELRRVRCCSKLQPEKADHMQMIRSGLALLYKNCMDPNERKLQRLSHLFALLSVLKLQFERPEEVADDVDHNRMAAALAYIGEHFREDLSLQDVASQVHISKSQLSRDFQKLLKISFSDYLRDIRLNHAAYLLRTTKDSLLDIGMDCGYYNQNTMIVNFRQKFGVTPGVYRQNPDAEPDGNEVQENNRSLFSTMSLLKHAAKEETLLLMNNKDSTSVYLNVDCAKGKEPLVLKHNEVINVGWADQLLQADLRNAIREGVRQIGFRYLMILGMFNDSMDIYHEEEDGSPWLSFTYLDSILDFVLELGAKPFL